MKILFFLVLWKNAGQFVRSKVLGICYVFYCYCAFFGENFFVMPKEFTNLTPCIIFCRCENVKIWLKLVQFLYFVNLWILKSKLKVQFDHLILNFCLNRIWKLLSMNESGFRNDPCSTIRKPAEMFPFVSKISDQTHLQTLACMILQNINLIMREEEEEKTRWKRLNFWYATRDSACGLPARKSFTLWWKALFLAQL